MSWTKPKGHAQAQKARFRTTAAKKIEANASQGGISRYSMYCSEPKASPTVFVGTPSSPVTGTRTAQGPMPKNSPKNRKKKKNCAIVLMV